MDVYRDQDHGNVARRMVRVVGTAPHRAGPVLARETVGAMKIPTMWDLDDALALVRGLQPLVRQFNYHVTLGGGVLNKGRSAKDLDLYFLAMSNTNILTDASGLCKFLQARWGEQFNLGGPSAKKVDIGHAYGAIEHFYCERLTYRPGGKRIDVFISQAA